MDVLEPEIGCPGEEPGEDTERNKGMPKKKTCHMYDTGDAVRSVMQQRKITSACGVVKVLAREDFPTDADFKTCPDCIRAANSDYDEWTIASPRGWTHLLERVWIAEHANASSTVWRYTMSWGSGTGRTDPPLAG